jgi:site-specific DNA-cytosine methylase
MKPLCVDLYAGLGGWSEGFLAEGYECIGYDIIAKHFKSVSE